MSNDAEKKENNVGRSIEKRMVPLIQLGYFSVYQQQQQQRKQRNIILKCCNDIKGFIFGEIVV